MAKFSKLEELSVMKETGMVPVFYHKDIAVAKQVLSACYKGGVRAFEFTNRGDFAQEVFYSDFQVLLYVYLIRLLWLLILVT